MCDLSSTGWPQTFIAWAEDILPWVSDSNFPWQGKSWNRVPAKSQDWPLVWATATGCNHVTILVLMMVLMKTKVYDKSNVDDSNTNTMRIIITIILDVCHFACIIAWCESVPQACYKSKHHLSLMCVDLISVTEKKRIWLKHPTNMLKLLFPPLLLAVLKPMSMYRI